MDDDLPSNYDVIVIGTGLVESIVAAAVSRIGKSVLHLDKNSYYGQTWSTFNLTCLEQWLACYNNKNNDVNSEAIPTDCKFYKAFTEEQATKNVQYKWFFPLNPEELLDSQNDEETSKIAADSGCIPWTHEKMKSLSQKFNIDLSPRIIFSKGPMVELLIKSEVCKYTEFINVHNILLYLNKTLEPVPYSKSDVFSSRSVSVVEKRILMKLLSEIQSVGENTLTYDYEGITFCDFLKKHNIPENLEKYIMYSIARVSKETSCVDGIRCAQIFLSSLGRYGNSPFLWPLYGSSELVQAFCRLCAVYGGIYCLNRGVEFVLTDEKKCIGVMSQGKKLMAEHVVMSSCLTPKEFFMENNATKTVLRGILITDRSLYINGKKGATLLHFPVEDDSKPPVTIIELDSSACACPSGLYLVHLINEVTNDGDYQDFEKIIKELFIFYDGKSLDSSDLVSDQVDNEENKKPRILFKVFFSIMQIDFSYSEIKPNNFYSCIGPSNAEFDFFSAIKSAEDIFNEMYPGEEFLPKPLNENGEEE